MLGEGQGGSSASAPSVIAEDWGEILGPTRRRRRRGCGRERRGGAGRAANVSQGPAQGGRGGVKGRASHTAPTRVGPAGPAQPRAQRSALYPASQGERGRGLSDCGQPAGEAAGEESCRRHVTLDVTA